MQVFYATLLTLVFLFGVKANAPNCDDLGFGTATTPTSGAGLNFCRLDADQCCTDDYFRDEYERINNKIHQDIRNGINSQFNRFSNLVDEIENFLTEDFVQVFSSSFCSDLITPDQCNTALIGARQSLIRHIYIGPEEENSPQMLEPGSQIFNPALALAEHLTLAIQQGLIKYYIEPRLNGRAVTQEEMECIHNASLASVQSEAYISGNLTQIRRAATALQRLRRHINETSLPEIRAVEPMMQCVASFINVDCKKCVEKIPSLCRGACDALANGCLAPFRYRLDAEFEILWNTTFNIIRIAGNYLPSIRNIFRYAYRVNISNAQAVQQLASSCGLTLNMTAMPTEGEPSVPIPDSTTMDLDDLSFVDVENVTQLPETVIATANELLDSGAFGNNDVLRCSKDYNNTNCWNGTATVAMNNINFVNTTLYGQRNNPLVGYNVTTLLDFSEANFEGFVSSFLESDHFRNIAPFDLYPSSNETINGTNGIEPAFDSASFVTVGYLMLLITVIAMLLMV